jgi:hypothetical protein
MEKNSYKVPPSVGEKKIGSTWVSTRLYCTHLPFYIDDWLTFKISTCASKKKFDKITTIHVENKFQNKSLNKF